MGHIKSGYCMVIQDFQAYCVPFTTVGVEYAENTVPVYTVEFPNGREQEFNETELKYTKEEIKELCVKKNKEMAERREDWLLNGLPAIRRFQSFGI